MREIARSLAVLVGFCLALPAQAAPIQYVVEGVISEGAWTTAGHPALGVFPVGTPTSLTFSLDSATPQTPFSAADPAIGTYPIGDGASFGFGELSFGFFTLGFLGEGVFGAQSPILVVENSSSDRFRVFADLIEPPCDPPGPTCPGVPVIHSLALVFGHTLGTWLDSDALPTGLSLPPTPFFPRGWNVMSSSGDVLVQVTPTSLEVVPEARVLPLAALAVASLVGARARRR